MQVLISDILQHLIEVVLVQGESTLYPCVTILLLVLLLMVMLADEAANEWISGILFDELK